MCCRLHTHSVEKLLQEKRLQEIADVLNEIYLTQENIFSVLELFQLIEVAQQKHFVCLFLSFLNRFKQYRKTRAGE